MILFQKYEYNKENNLQNESGHIVYNAELLKTSHFPNILWQTANLFLWKSLVPSHITFFYEVAISDIYVGLSFAGYF